MEGIVKVFNGIVEFFRTIGETFIWSKNSLVEWYQTDPELRAVIYLVGWFLLAWFLGWINHEIVIRTSYIVEKDDGYYHPMYSRRLHQINYKLVHVEAVILFVVGFFAFYVRPTDLFWGIFMIFCFEYALKSMIETWEDEERDYNRRVSREYNEERDEAELNDVMDFCDLDDPEDRSRLQTTVVSIQEYRRRTGNCGDIVCVKPDSSKVE